LLPIPFVPIEPRLWKYEIVHRDGLRVALTTMAKKEKTMAKEKFSENPKIKVTEKKSKLKKVKLSAPSRSGAKQVGKKASKGFPPSWQITAILRRSMISAT
jgi:hypothetical protein